MIQEQINAIEVKQAQQMTFWKTVWACVLGHAIVVIAVLPISFFMTGLVLLSGIK